MDTRRVAVIDLGSNSFKLLVAEGEKLCRVFEAYEDVRLLDKKAAGTISPDKFALGVATVKRLFSTAQDFHPQATAIVGTSVFRSATNAREFSEAIFTATGVSLRVLSGEEEAVGIACGVASDPLVHELPRKPVIFDLGGGSLEFIADDGNYVKSWPLGAVRIVREFVAKPEAPVSASTLQKIRNHVRSTVAAELDARTNPETPLVFCGGVLEVAHRVLAGKAGVDRALFPRKISALRLEVLLEHLAMRTAKERTELDGVPASRADIAPAALAVILEVAEICNVMDLIYSPRNLRYGIASQLLSASGL